MPGDDCSSWAQAAGFTDVTATASVWCFATPEDRSWWGGLWADRVMHSAFGQQALASGSDRGRRAGGDRRRVAILGDPTRWLVHGAGRGGPVSPWPYPVGVTLYRLDDPATPSPRPSSPPSTAGSTPGRRRRPRSTVWSRRAGRRDVRRGRALRLPRPPTPLEIADGRLAELTWPEFVAPPGPRRRPRPPRPVGPEPDYRWRRSSPIGDRGRQPTRRGGVDQPRRDPGRRAPYPARADPRDRVAAGSPARRHPAGTGRDLRVPSALVSVLEMRGRGRYRGGRLLRPGPPLRLRSVSGRLSRCSSRSAATSGSTSRAVTAARRPSSSGPARRGDRDRREHPHATSSGSRRWSTRSGSRRATT